MKILFVGDIVGSPGREIVSRVIPQLRKEYELDLVIANGENSAHGKGITQKIYKQLLAYGIDCITMGNHTFSKDDLFRFIEEADRLVRPANMEPLEYGKSTRILQVKGKRVAISNVCGEVWMNNVVDSPFACMEDILMDEDADIYPDGSLRLSERIRMCRLPTNVLKQELRQSAIWVCAVLIAA